LQDPPKFPQIKIFGEKTIWQPGFKLGQIDYRYDDFYKHCTSEFAEEVEEDT
jgi:hypothetical protein